MRKPVVRTNTYAAPAGATLTARALTNFKQGDYISAARNAQLAHMDLLLRGLIPDHTDWKQQPQGLESAVPVWGAGRKAIADVYAGDYAGAALNTGLAVLDRVAANIVIREAEKHAAFKAIAKQGVKNRAKDPYRWEYQRRHMGKRGFYAPDQIGHHAFIPQSGWGKRMPNALKNHPMNIKPMPNRPVHNRVHGQFGQAPYNSVQRYIRGTPAWAQSAKAEIFGRMTSSAKARHDQNRQDKK